MSDFWLCGRFHIACVWMLFLSVTASTKCGVGAECAPGWDVLLVCLLNGFSGLRTRAHCLSCCLPLLSTGRNGGKPSPLVMHSECYSPNTLTLPQSPLPSRIYWLWAWSPFFYFLTLSNVFYPHIPNKLLLRTISTSLLPNLKVSNWSPFCEILHALLASLPEQPVLFNLSLLLFFLSRILAIFPLCVLWLNSASP